MALRNPITYPLLAFCCLFLVLLCIAITIVLALIPVFLPPANLTPASIYSQSKAVVLYIPVDDSLSYSNLTDAAKASLLDTFKSTISADEKSSSDIAVESATITDTNGSRKRAVTGKRWLKLILIVYGRYSGIITIIEKRLMAYINVHTDIISNIIVALSGTTTSTATSPVSATNPVSATSPVSTNPSGRRRRRRENAEATHPSPLVTYRD